MQTENARYATTLASNQRTEDAQETVVVSLERSLAKCRDGLVDHISRLAAMRDRMFGAEPLAGEQQLKAHPMPDGASNILGAEIDEMAHLISHAHAVVRDLERFV